jgi:hypothetical protein
MSSVACQGAQLIPGYVLLDRLGAGAYGEVWRAEVPGGLTKAVKVVYGYHNEVRASRELKALEQVKQLRHPFLLSLERIEIVDGRLIIVTEMADMSLKQRYLDCVDAGAPGIARDELLSHLRDAADALDFLNTSQSLQHLDVKAENLLLVGGRLKVGDFGLVRNLAECDGSLLEAMTPRYAAPEVFEGRPTKYSDQFSLAVVFVELLCGTPPFDAKSPAQFAAQHVLGTKPHLDQLTPADRAVVARALSKKPEDRFPNCRSFVDCLTAGSILATPPEIRPAGGALVSRPSAPSGPDVAGTAASERRTGGGRAEHRAACGDDATLVLEVDSSLRDLPVGYGLQEAAKRLPPVEAESFNWEPGPTLVIALGGAATRVLRGLAERLAGRFPTENKIPAWRMLALDTDVNALRSAAKDGALGAADLLPLTLHSTQEYRTRSPQVLKWLSRRWLYNIPREPRTSGWRPLGRLALVDHAAEVIERLRKSLEEFVSPAALATSAETLGRPLTGRPVIVLLASTSGGTGSGTVLDMAYTVRKLAVELNLADYELRGLLMHSTDRDPALDELARANSLACLTELAHLNRPGGGYPGEESLGLPTFPSILPTFDETLFVHLGDALESGEFFDQLDRVSDYLYHRLATRAGTLLAQIHASEGAGQACVTGEISVRTFGLYAANNLKGDVVEGYVDQLCQAVAEKWLGPNAPPASIGRPRMPETHDGSSEELKALVESVFGPAVDRTFVRNLAGALDVRLDTVTDPRLHSIAPAKPGLPDLASAGCIAALTNLASALGRGADRSIANAKALNRPGDASNREAPLWAIHSAVQSLLAERIAELAVEIARDFPAAYLSKQRHAGIPTAVAIVDMAAALRAASAAAIDVALRQVDVSQLLVDLTGKSTAAREPMRGLVKAAQPRLSGAGALERLLVFAPPSADRSVLARFFAEDLDQPATVVGSEDERLTICIERDQLRIRDVAATLLGTKIKTLELAARLHTRSDVQWTPLRLG